MQKTVSKEKTQNTQNLSSSNNTRQQTTNVSREIVPTNQALKAYQETRMKGAKALEKINKKTEEFEKFIQDMREKFQSSIRPLEEEFFGIQKGIQKTQSDAIEKLLQIENQIIADKSITNEEKIEKIQQLRNVFLEIFIPDDDYRKHVKKYDLHTLQQALSSAMKNNDIFSDDAGVGGFAILSIGGPGPVPMMANSRMVTNGPNLVGNRNTKTMANRKNNNSNLVIEEID